MSWNSCPCASRGRLSVQVSKDAGTWVGLRVRRYGMHWVMDYRRGYDSDRLTQCGHQQANRDATRHHSAFRGNPSVLLLFTFGPFDRPPVLMIWICSIAETLSGPLRIVRLPHRPHAHVQRFDSQLSATCGHAACNARPLMQAMGEAWWSTLRDDTY
jgi:hypothetical protein